MSDAIEGWAGMPTGRVVETPTDRTSYVSTLRRANDRLIDAAHRRGLRQIDERDLDGTGLLLTDSDGNDWEVVVRVDWGEPEQSRVTHFSVRDGWLVALRAPEEPEEPETRLMGTSGVIVARGVTSTSEQVIY